MINQLNLPLRLLLRCPLKKSHFLLLLNYFILCVIHHCLLLLDYLNYFLRFLLLFLLLLQFRHQLQLQFQYYLCEPYSKLLLEAHIYLIWPHHSHLLKILVQHLSIKIKNRYKNNYTMPP